MLELAVATQEETFDRMGEPLSHRDIIVRPIHVSERILDLTAEKVYPPCDVGFVYPPRIMEGAVAESKLSIPWVNDREAVLASRNKAGVLSELAAAEIPVPKSILVSNPVGEDDLIAAFERIGPPVVVKPNSTTRGVGVAKVDDLDSFLGLCDYLDLVHDFRATGDKSFLVQEYVPDARDVRVMTIEKRYVGAVERKIADVNRDAGRWKHNVHRGGTAERIDPNDDIRTLAERTAQALGVDWLGVDLLVTENRVLVSETNARPTIDDASKYDSDFYDRLASLIRSRTETVITE